MTKAGRTMTREQKDEKNRQAVERRHQSTIDDIDTYEANLKIRRDRKRVLKHTNRERYDRFRISNNASQQLRRVKAKLALKLL